MEWNASRVEDFMFSIYKPSRNEKTGQQQSLQKGINKTRQNLYDPLRKIAKLEEMKWLSLPSNSRKEIARNIATSIKNNIQNHFFRRQCKYIQIRDNLTKEEAKEKQKKINEEAELTGKSSDNSLPSKIEKSVAYDLKVY